MIGAAFAGDALILAQMSSATLRYYDRATGELIRTIGGEGEGPGEYELFSFLQAAGDRLYTFDPMKSRLTVLDLAGAVEFGKRGGRTVQWSGPFQREASVGLLGDEYYLLDNMEFAIPVFDQKGRLVRELGPDVRPEPIALTPADRRGFRELDRIEGWERPEFYPYYASIRELDGVIWVLHYKDATSAGHRWTLYSRDGDLVGRVATSETIWVFAADGDVVAVMRINDLGVETVELRRLVGWP